MSLRWLLMFAPLRMVFSEPFLGVVGPQGSAPDVPEDPVQDGSSEAPQAESPVRGNSSTSVLEDGDSAEEAHRNASEADVDNECSTSVEGEECHFAVVEAQHALILQHPEWYPGLSHHSTFEEFQDFLHAQGVGNCNRPCNLCHTVLQGDGCWEKVQWAMLVGIREHPEWYPGLASGSSFEEFQSLFHRSGGEQGDCPTEPCDLCRVVINPEEPCYREVDWAMMHGIHSHPEWYPGLSSNASRIQFQQVLSLEYSCPPPCGLCHTAEEGEECHAGVTWAKGYGITQFPEWYPGLTAESSLHEFQVHLHKERHHNCPMPCNL